jgi:hypothetical protein
LNLHDLELQIVDQAVDAAIFNYKKDGKTIKVEETGFTGIEPTEIYQT